MRVHGSAVVAIAVASFCCFGCGRPSSGDVGQDAAGDASIQSDGPNEPDPKTPSPGQLGEHPVFQKGFTFAAWTAGEYQSTTSDRQLAELAKGGVEWVALNPRWVQNTRSSTVIEPHPKLSPTDGDVCHAVRTARRLGLRVFLKPQLDLTGQGWRGQIRFESEDAWRSWFTSYERFITHYADLAQEEGVSLLCVGVELDATRHREGDWRRVIASVRKRFDGPLTFAANWAREADVRWWDALDYAGVDAYFPLADEPGRSVEELKAAWKKHRDRLRVWQAQIGKPVLFTEIGYRSVDHAAVEPWEYQKRGRPASQEQANLYQAALETFWPEPWFYGMYWWQWRTFPPADPQADDQFTPQGKPAWELLHERYHAPPPIRGATIHR
ncbi:MAG: glycoside hydrolase family 113 [Planctomycetota bacterium]|jgi:hypothetical protein